MFPGGNKQTVGTCGLCGGAVTLPIAYWSVIPPVPTCSECGATAKQDHGPIMPMNPPGKTWTSDKIEIDPDSHKRFGIQISDNTECCVR
jgi:hypothetical protein